MRKLLPLLVVVAVGCDDDAASESPVDASVAVDQGAGDAGGPFTRTPVYRSCNVLTDQCALPFPNNLFARVDESTATGLRVDLSGPAISDLWDRLAVVTHDGFSPVGAVVTLLPAAVDEALVPVSPEASLEPDAAVWLLEAGHEEGERGRRVAFTGAIVEDVEADQRLLVLTPAQALHPGGRYAVLVRRALAQPNEAMATLLGDEAPAGDLDTLWAYYADLRELLEELDVDASDVGQLWDFRVRSEAGVTGDLKAMVAFNRRWVEENPPSVTLAEGREVRNGVLRYDFSFEVPIWREGRDAHIERGDDGMPVPVRFDEIRGALLVPPSATEAAPVLPVLFGHGLAASAEVMIPVISEMDLGGAGLATMVVDWDLHGSRGRGVNDIIEVAGALNVLAFSGMMLQSAADAIVFRAVLASIGEVPGRGAVLRENGPQLYLGQSLGSLLGVLVAAVEPGFDAVVLNVGGMGMSNILRTGEVIELLGLRHRIREVVEANPVEGASVELTIETLMIMSQLGLDFGEPGVFAPHVLRDRYDDSPPPAVLLQQSIGDGIMPNLTTDALARTMGLPLIEPAVRPVGELQRASAPTAGEPASGMTQFRVTEEGFEAHLAMSHLPVQTQALRYFGSFIDDDADNDGDIAYDCGGGPCDLVDD